MNIAEIPDGTRVRGTPIRYDDEDADVDVPDYDAEGVGALVEGPLAKLPSLLGHTSYFAGRVAVEEESIEVVKQHE